MQAPQSVRAVTDISCFEIEWPETGRIAIPFKVLRGECPCAACVNEFTGEKLIDPATISDEIRPIEMEYVGNYAIKVRWSDNHDTGLFTFDRLRLITEAIRRHLDGAPG